MGQSVNWKTECLSSFLAERYDDMMKQIVFATPKLKHDTKPY